MTDAFFAPAEFKFAADTAPAGEFKGYAACFGNIDSHGDVIQPGAFRHSLEERKAQGRPIPMHVMHRLMGDGLPVGVWKVVEEDERGLRVEGKISGMNTDQGRLTYERMVDGAFGGLSIGYKVRPDGAILGKGNGQPKRTLVNLWLSEISLVDEPSNSMTRIDEIKAAVRDEMGGAKMQAAAEALGEAMKLIHGGSGDDDEQHKMLSYLCDAHEALTGLRMPVGMKATPNTLREFEAMLRASGFSNSQARSIAEGGFKSKAAPRDEDVRQAVAPEVKAVLDDVHKLVSGFSLKLKK